MKSILSRYIPWVITIVALYFAFKGIDPQTLKRSLLEAKLSSLVLALIFTVFSYVFRARRWQYLFSKPVFKFKQSLEILFLGFFMNNVLPARTGEIVRAHMGAKASGEKRTLVLASIALERLLDGIMLSALFLLFATRIGDEELSTNMSYVAILFATALLGVAVLLLSKNLILGIIEKFHNRSPSKTSDYLLDRVEVFLNGLSPLFSLRNAPILIFWSLVVWFIELCVYLFVGNAFSVPLSLPYAVLFLVTVNFSSLIPAAPGGIGVIEAVTTTVLVSLGIEKEIALAMVFSQHLIQYIVVGVPGAFAMLKFKPKLDVNESSTA